MDPVEVSNLLLDYKALKFNVKEPFTYTSGIKSPVYVDCRQMISEVEPRKKLVEALSDMVGKLEPDIVAATATAAIPWGAWVSDRLSKPMVYVRKSAKTHGLGKGIEGRVQPYQKAVVVEDLVSTGVSSLSTVNALRDATVIAEHVVCLFEYNLVDAIIEFEKNGVTLHPLCDFQTAIDVAAKKGFLSENEVSEARKWVKKPGRWNK